MEISNLVSAMVQKDNQGMVPPRATDPGWAHGTMVNGGRQKIKCRYCDKIFLGGGISRLKQHLAGERGNVAPCEEVPEEVKVQIKEHLGSRIVKRRKKRKGNKNATSIFGSYSQDMEEEEDEGDKMQVRSRTRNSSLSKTRRIAEPFEGTSSSRAKRKIRQKISTFSSVSHPTTQNFASQESSDQADIAVARFFYDAGIPFTVANSTYFQQMADAITAVGSGYKMPSYHSLRGKLLNRSVRDAEEYCLELRNSWEVTGCSVLVDRWADKSGCVVVNFFVYCPKGTLFLKSIDASEITKSVDALLYLFEAVVQEVGPKNIINFVTDTSPNHKAAGKLLMEKYRTFFSSTCGVQCIELMLEEIGQMDEVKEVLAKAKRLTQFIYNNSWVLSSLRKKTGERDIIQLAVTRFASIFLTLQSIVSSKDSLHQMFTSSVWMQSAFCKRRIGLEVEETVTDPHFWSQCKEVLKFASPLLSIIYFLDREDKPSIGYIYDAIEKAKRSIVAAFDDKESDYTPYLEVIDRIWQEEFHSPLHAAACYLNPSSYYSPGFSSNKVIQKGLLDCIETLVPDVNTQVTITSSINAYSEAIGDFGRPVALHGRETLAPATWWSLYAADYPDLQRLAVRIVSQTCSVSSCKKSWAMFRSITSKQRNQLESQKLNDLMFVHYNLQLQERRGEAATANCTKGKLDPLCLEAVYANMGDWIEDPRAIDEEDPNWLDITISSEPILTSPELQNIDDANESTDDGSSDITKGNDNR